MIPEVLSFNMSGLSSLGDDSKCLKFKFYNLSNVPYIYKMHMQASMCAINMAISNHVLTC